jgi:hypothetical protein
MKSIKMLGLIAIAALMAMALLSVTSAMAESTALCKEEALSTPCLIAKQVSHVHEETLTGSKSTWLTSAGNVECNVLFLGNVLETGEDKAEKLFLGAPIIIHGHFTYSECKRGTENCIFSETSADALVSVLKEGHETAKVTFLFELNFHCGFFINCTYDGENLVATAKGPLLATSLNGEATITKQTMHHTAGSFCPALSELDISMMPLEHVYISS